MDITWVGAEQPDLVSAIAPSHRAEAVAATWAVTLHFHGGPWAAEALHGPPGHLGVLILDGLLSRVVLVGPRAYVELLGVDDLLRPWDPPDGVAPPSAETSWTAHTAIRVAVLDRAFALRTGAYPEVTAALMSLLVRRSRRLAFQVAISHLPQLDVRLRLMFWHLADRWGRVTPDGVVVPLGLGHAMLGGLVGAHRSPVTRALGRLRANGEVTRLPDGTWLLHGDRPEGLTDVVAHARCS